MNGVEHYNPNVNNPNCALFAAPGRCSALTDVHGEQKPLTCKKCAFYKTKHDLDKGRRQARQRLLSLPPDRLTYLLETYYSAKARKNINGEG